MFPEVFFIKIFFTFFIVIVFITAVSCIFCLAAVYVISLFAAFFAIVLSAAFSEVVLFFIFTAVFSFTAGGAAVLIIFMPAVRTVFGLITVCSFMTAFYAACGFIPAFFIIRLFFRIPFFLCIRAGLVRCIFVIIKFPVFVQFGEIVCLAVFIFYV